jgi:quinol monooxygenase YgiN
MAESRRLGTIHRFSELVFRSCDDRSEALRSVLRAHPKERLMTTYFVRHRVADFDEWKKGYEAAEGIQRDGGVTDEAVYRDPDDPQFVLVMHRFESKDQGERFMSNPDLIEAQRQAGVDPDSVRVEAYEEA